jgi:hypothetical protein
MLTSMIAVKVLDQLPDPIIPPCSSLDMLIPTYRGRPVVPAACHTTRDLLSLETDYQPGMIPTIAVLAPCHMALHA